MQPYHYSLMYYVLCKRTIRFSGKRIREIERDREGERSTEVYGYWQKWYHNILRWCYQIEEAIIIDVSDNIYEWLCPADFSYICFFKIMNFSGRFGQCFKLFYSLEKQLFMNSFQKVIQEKQRDGFEAYYCCKEAYFELS